jgi:hypothetical protein
MASSSEAWVLGGVRLISSASSRLVNTGPSRNRNDPSRCSKMTCPVTSDGIRSGVNWTRLKSRSRVRARVLTSSVLATPGTPSSSTCPLTSSAATSPDTAPSCPTTALAISSRTRSTAPLGPAGSAGREAGVAGPGGRGPAPAGAWGTGVVSLTGTPYLGVRARRSVAGRVGSRVSGGANPAPGC